MGKCIYSEELPKHYPWVTKTKCNCKAHCQACKKDIDVEHKWVKLKVLCGHMQTERGIRT